MATRVEISYEDVHGRKSLTVETTDTGEVTISTAHRGWDVPNARAAVEAGVPEELRRQAEDPERITGRLAITVVEQCPNGCRSFLVKEKLGSGSKAPQVTTAYAHVLMSGTVRKFWAIDPVALQALVSLLETEFEQEGFWNPEIEDRSALLNKFWPIQDLL